MARIKNLYAVEGAVYSNAHMSPDGAIGTHPRVSRRVEVNGPWSSSPETAIRLFAKLLKKRGLDHEMVREAAIYERPYGTVAGYRDVTKTYRQFWPALKDAGVRIPGHKIDDLKSCSVP